MMSLNLTPLEGRLTRSGIVNVLLTVLLLVTKVDGQDNTPDISTTSILAPSTSIASQSTPILAHATSGILQSTQAPNSTHSTSQSTANVGIVNTSATVVVKNTDNAVPQISQNVAQSTQLLQSTHVAIQSTDTAVPQSSKNAFQSTQLMQSTHVVIQSTSVLIVDTSPGTSIMSTASLEPSGLDPLTATDSGSIVVPSTSTVFASQTLRSSQASNSETTTFNDLETWTGQLPSISATSKLFPSSVDSASMSEMSSTSGVTLDTSSSGFIALFTSQSPHISTFDASSTAGTSLLPTSTRSVYSTNGGSFVATDVPSVDPTGATFSIHFVTSTINDVPLNTQYISEPSSSPTTASSWIPSPTSSAPMTSSNYDDPWVEERNMLNGQVNDLDSQVKSLTIAVGILAALLILCILGIIIYAVVKYKRKKRPEERTLDEMRKNTKIQREGDGYFRPQSDYGLIDLNDDAHKNVLRSTGGILSFKEAGDESESQLDNKYATKQKHYNNNIYDNAGADTGADDPETQLRSRDEGDQRKSDVAKDAFVDIDLNQQQGDGE